MILSHVLLTLLISPQIPDSTQPPPAAHVRYTVKAQGVQIYHCAAQDGSFVWAFQSPEADLFDTRTNQPIGTHTAGPTWTWSDGSSITGKVLQKQPSTDPLAIPWLLLETHPANDVKGALSDITFVRRSDTQAGSAPAKGCDAQNQGTILRVPYAAIYTFYSTAP